MSEIVAIELPDIVELEIKTPKCRERKTPETIQANPNEFPKKITKFHLKFINAVVDSKYKNYPTINREIIFDIMKTHGVKFPWWLVYKYSAGRGKYINPVRFVTAENTNNLNPTVVLEYHNEIIN